tara:strand:- start:127 stop:309 length:183 start_codon:yes stop_codon:yes gene_type:complete
MDEINITSAQYRNDWEGNRISIGATINGVVIDVPLDSDNRHYDAIMKAVEAGEITIQDAD